MEEPSTGALRVQTMYRTVRRHALAVLIGAAAFAPAGAQEQLARAPVPTYGAAPTEAAAPRVDETRRYRATGAQHLYDTYRQRIFKGKLPPLLYAIAITETEIDEHGHVVNATLVREPAAAKEVGPWVLSLIHAASPFPKPQQAGTTRYLDVWLVDRSYTFQLDTLTEGQL